MLQLCSVLPRPRNNRVISVPFVNCTCSDFLLDSPSCERFEAASLNANHQSTPALVSGAAASIGQALSAPHRVTQHEVKEKQHRHNSTITDRAGAIRRDNHHHHHDKKTHNTNTSDNHNSDSKNRSDTSTQDQAQTRAVSRKLDLARVLPSRSCTPTGTLWCELS